MKAWWKIHKKPRGRWRPLLEWGISLSPEEKKAISELNLNVLYKYVICSPKCIHCSKVTAADIWVALPERLYPEHTVSVGKGYTSGVRCYTCEHQEETWTITSDSRNICDPFSFRLPWRPGVRPDYTDFIQPIREFLAKLLDLCERRFQEAQESAPSDEWMLEEEFDSFTWRTLDSGVEVAERKLRVIRR